MMAVIIPEGDIKKLRTIAEQRNNKKQGVPTLKIAKQYSDYAIHFFGLLGEYAVAKILNIPMDTSINPIGGDQGYDLIYTNEHYTQTRIDVKFTMSKQDCLFFTSNNKFKADIAILTKPIKNNRPLEGIRVAGWITKEGFKEKSIPLTKGRCVKTKNLKRPPTLKDFLDCQVKEE